MSVVAVGWDVGGWLGKANAVAVARSDAEGVVWAGHGVGRLPKRVGALPEFVAASRGRRRRTCCGWGSRAASDLADPIYEVVRPDRHPITRSRSGRPTARSRA